MNRYNLYLSVALFLAIVGNVLLELSRQRWFKARQRELERPTESTRYFSPGIYYPVTNENGSVDFQRRTEDITHHGYDRPMQMSPNPPERIK